MPLFDAVRLFNRIKSMKFIFILLFLTISCKSPSVYNINPLEAYLDPQIKADPNLREDYIQLMASYRHDQGLNSYIYSKELELKAQEHSEKMASGSVAFGHTGSSLRCSELILEMVSGNLCGEIIAKGQESAEAVFAAWMSSITHAGKILNTRYTHTGLGIAKSEAGVIYWTQIFLEVE